MSRERARFRSRGIGLRLLLLSGLPVCWCMVGVGAKLLAAEAVSSAGAPTHPGPTNILVVADLSTRFTVRAYEARGEPLLPASTLAPIFTKHVGTNIELGEIVKAASDLQAEYANRGAGTVSVAIAQERITNGLVTLNVFRGRVPQILVSGKRYTGLATELALAAPAAGGKTNTGPRFAVRAYEIRGDTLLTTNTLTSILLKYTGTNIGLAEITKAASELQMEYRSRGYPTVSVTVPQQQLADGIVKIRVFQGTLSDVQVVGNHFFSSNNVMRELPSLRIGTILNGPVFQAELDRANANQDRQIYPEIQPGARANTTELLLRVKDRFPLHAKVELNNQSSPGTPELRINTSAVYNNLWQLEHSMGVQYSFSPEQYKDGDQWGWYDRPLVANYSAFYRMPLGNPEAVAAVVASQPGTFGYDEASQKFRLPPPSGISELNVYASRSTIDTSVQTLLNENLFNLNGNSVDRQDVQEDLTINRDIGTRLSIPLRGSDTFRSGFSGGLDFKSYELTSFKTNLFTLTSFNLDFEADPSHPQTNISRSVDTSPVPTTHRKVEYLPLALRYDGSQRDALGVTAFGLGLSGNPWFSDSVANLQGVTGSAQSSGYWVVLNPTLSREIFIHTNWVMTVHADGQWASEPLLSNEQFGIGGVNSVRGYREGEVFGDTGWRLSVEQRTPPYVVGLAYGKSPLTVRGSVYMDYAETFLLDPNGRKDRVSLWGTGFGAVATLGSHWEARFLFSWPLLRTAITEPGEPRFDFSLTAQF